MNHAELVLRFPDAAVAARALQSMAPDNGGHCTMSLDDATLRVVASAPKTGTLLATLDDVLGCLRALDPVL